MTRRYDVAPDRSTLSMLARLEGGVSRLAAYRAYPHFPQCSALYLQYAEGRWLELSASGHELEPRFEVFVLQGRDASPVDRAVHHDASLAGPVECTPLLTEQWLDPTVAATPALGDRPIMQCAGAPGSAPASATAACQFMGGVRLQDARGVVVYVATAAFPHDLHVTGLSDDPRFRQADYVPLSTRR